MQPLQHTGDMGELIGENRSRVKYRFRSIFNAVSLASNNRNPFIQRCCEHLQPLIFINFNIPVMFPHLMNERMIGHLIDTHYLALVSHCDSQDDATMCAGERLMGLWPVFFAFLIALQRCSLAQFWL